MKRVIRYTWVSGRGLEPLYPLHVARAKWLQQKALLRLKLAMTPIDPVAVEEKVQQLH